MLAVSIRGSWRLVEVSIRSIPAPISGVFLLCFVMSNIKRKFEHTNHPPCYVLHVNINVDYSCVSCADEANISCITLITAKPTVYNAPVNQISSNLQTELDLVSSS